MIRLLLPKTLLLNCCLYLITCPGNAQPNPKQEIDRINTPAVGLAPLRFLASDELMGRATLRPEINIAARYISEAFRGMGVKEVPGTADYFQRFDLRIFTPAKSGSLTVNDKKYDIGTDMLQLQGGDASLTAPVVYAGRGTKDEFDNLDLKGKIAVADLGKNDSSSYREGYQSIAAKQRLAQDKGAVALIVRAGKIVVPWAALKSRTMDGRVESGQPVSCGVFLIDDTNGSLQALLKGAPVNATLSVNGSKVRVVPVKNVMGWVEGTDARLKEQYIVLSAHYDHLGVARQPQMEEGKMDSIFNGARDNAIGTAAVMDAARYFVQHPPKRSVLFIAYTGEEMGELGSKYFAAHPAIPLRKLVYNLNIDNASYNDTTIVSVIGLGRTSADDAIKRGCAAYGLTALPDPAPDQNLFDRSDNTNLAVKGIPAPTFSLGMRKFDETITNRYHRLSDEVGNFNLSYAMKYINAFILSAKYIADEASQPVWDKGDKYEPAWKALYQQ